MNLGIDTLYKQTFDNAMLMRSLFLCPDCYAYDSLLFGKSYKLP